MCVKGKTRGSGKTRTHSSDEPRAVRLKRRGRERTCREWVEKKRRVNGGLWGKGGGGKGYGGLP